MNSDLYLWRATPARGRFGQLYWMVSRATPGGGKRYYGGGTTGQRVSRYGSEAAAKKVADRLNRQG